MQPSKEGLDIGVVFGQLRRRRKLIPSVVVTGGEPTMHEDLHAFLKRLHAMDLFIKLDTNGSNPAELADLLKAELINYIAMDIKAPFSKYSLLAGVSVSLSCIKESINLISKSGVEHEFRTTFFPELLDRDDISEIRAALPFGSVHRLQAYRAVG